MKEGPPDSATTITHTLPESGSGTGAPNTLSGANGTSQVELQALVDRLRSTGMGITITGEGKVCTFSRGSDAVVDELEIIEGTDAWHYHNNSLYSGCILEIEGLPRMHACADYLSLRSHFFTAMFTNPLRESMTRVIRLTPPDPSTFLWALHHLYTGAMSHEHKKLLVGALDNGDGATFWSLYENASFLDCPTLTDECMGLLGVWVAKAEYGDYRGNSQSHLPASGGDPRHAVFRHPTFQPSLVWPAALVELLRPLHSAPLRLYLVLAWLDNEERGTQQATDLELLPTDLRQIITTCASEAIEAGAGLLKLFCGAFPCVVRRVVLTPALILPRLEKLEQAEREARLSMEQKEREAIVLTQRMEKQEKDVELRGQQLGKAESEWKAKSDHFLQRMRERREHIEAIANTPISRKHACAIS